MKTNLIIVRFLDTYLNHRIGNHTLQIEIPKFALSVYNKFVNPETVSREWRKLRNDKEFLKKHGYSIIEDLEQTGKEKTFIIRRLNEVYRDSKGCSEQTGDVHTTDRIEESHQGKTGTV